MTETNTQSDLRDGQKVVAVGAAQHHVIAQRVHEAQAVRHVAQLHVQLLVEPAPVGRLAADRQLSAPTENTRFEPSMFLPVVICASRPIHTPTFFTESEWGLQMM